MYANSYLSVIAPDSTAPALFPPTETSIANNFTAPKRSSLQPKLPLRITPQRRSALPSRQNCHCERSEAIPFLAKHETASSQRTLLAATLLTPCHCQRSEASVWMSLPAQRSNPIRRNRDSSPPHTLIRLSIVHRPRSTVHCPHSILQTCRQLVDRDLPSRRYPSIRIPAALSIVIIQHILELKAIDVMALGFTSRQGIVKIALG